MLVAKKGYFYMQISYNITPKDQMSAFLVISLSSHPSGAKKNGVPTLIFFFY